MSTWNYRIGTKFLKYDVNFSAAIGRKGERMFSVISCYYDECDKKPRSYGENNPLDDQVSLKDLKARHKQISLAFKKPILDLDNFPKEYKLKKEKKKK